MRLFVIAGLVSTLWSVSISASDVEKVVICESCNDAEARNLAQIEALFAPPQLEQESQLVYIADYVGGAVRLFEVDRELLSDCSAGSGDPLADCAESWATIATQIDPATVDVREIVDSIQAYKRFVEDVTEQEAGDLPLDGFPIDSAADLIGSVGGPPADHDPAYLRGVLENAVSDAMTDGFWERRGRETLDLGGQVWASLVGERRGIDVITVEFSDGTTIELDVENAKWENGSLVSFSLSVDLTSASGPGLPQLPSDPGSFMTGPIANGGLVGSLAYLQNLADLFVRGGGRVNHSRTGNTCQSKFECFYVQDPETGDWKRRCKLTSPKPELNC